MSMHSGQPGLDLGRGQAKQQTRNGFAQVREGIGNLICLFCSRKDWRPIPAFLPGKLQAQRSLAGYSP